MPDVTQFPACDWYAVPSYRRVELPRPAIPDSGESPSSTLESFVREWRFVTQVADPVPGLTPGVSFGPVEGVDRDGWRLVADRLVLTDAAELPGGGVRYTATASGLVRMA